MRRTVRKTRRVTRSRWRRGEEEDGEEYADQEDMEGEEDGRRGLGSPVGPRA